MDNAQLISLSRQMALQRQMDVVANNLANLNTTGFKAESLLFEDYISPTAEDDLFAGADRDIHFTQDWSSLHDMGAGPIVSTGNQLDVAIEGDGFLVVQTAAGERYTRAGSLQIDASGALVDLNGNPVLSDLGPIRFEPSETSITVAKNGAILTNEGAKGALRIVEFDDPRALTRAGNNLFSGEGANRATATSLVQGALEQSNVSGVTEIANMIRVQRAYASMAQMMQRQDEVRRTAIQRLGSLNA
ncbi:MAG: flagellar basal-body rod protein FlgF [Devosia sp.]